MIYLPVVKLFPEGTCSDTNCWKTKKEGESVFTFLPVLTIVYKLQINQQYIINISSVYHEHINISIITSSTEYTRIYVEIQTRENHEIISYISKNAFIGSTKFPILQLQLEGGYDPLFTFSNLKEATTP
jgi:hypothetical protein